MFKIAKPPIEGRRYQGNTKTGPAFSIPDGLTCPGKTDICASLCYVQTGRMNLPVARDARAKTYANVIQLLKTGGPEELAKVLIASIKQSGTKTLRIHDSGDFFSPAYIRAWQIVVLAMPDVRFWAYTRSWRVASMIPALKALASTPNMSLWISADIECWLDAKVIAQDDVWGGIAFMETADDGSADIAAVLNKSFGGKKRRFINFPTHGHFGKIKIQVQSGILNCPAITKAIPHSDSMPACLTCNLCLPS